MLLLACGGPTDPAIDGGADDSSIPDAGPDDGGIELDAGSDPDGGMAGPTVSGARDEARARVDTMEMARVAVPVDMRVGSAFLHLDLISTRLDAIIGEKSTSLIEVAGIIGEKSMTRSLTVVAVPALVIALQLDATVRDLDAMIAVSTWSASGEPTLVALEIECVAMRGEVAALRDVMWARFRELADGAVVMPRDEPGYVDTRIVETITGTTAIDVVVEGRSATDPTATVSADCSDFPANVRVLDAEGGELVPETVGPGGEPNVIPIELGHDDLHVLRIEVSVTDLEFWNTCTVSVSGRRRLRGARETIDALEQRAITTEATSWATNGDGLRTALDRARTAGSIDVGRIEAVEHFAREATAAVSRQRNLQVATSIDVEDWEIDQLVLERIILPLADTLIADPEIAADVMLTGHISAWQSSIREMLVESAPGHEGGTL